MSIDFDEDTAIKIRKNVMWFSSLGILITSINPNFTNFQVSNIHLGMPAGKFYFFMFVVWAYFIWRYFTNRNSKYIIYGRHMASTRTRITETPDEILTKDVKYYLSKVVLPAVVKKHLTTINKTSKTKLYLSGNEVGMTRFVNGMLEIHYGLLEVDADKSTNKGGIVSISPFLYKVCKIKAYMHLCVKTTYFSDGLLPSFYSLSAFITCLSIVVYRSYVGQLP